MSNNATAPWPVGQGSLRRLSGPCAGTSIRMQRTPPRSRDSTLMRLRLPTVASISNCRCSPPILRVTTRRAHLTGKGERMVLDEIVLHNFGVYRGRQTLQLTPPSLHQPIILIG